MILPALVPITLDLPAMPYPLLLENRTYTTLAHLKKHVEQFEPTLD